MKIKNTRELVLRARAHARQDHIIQGTYGSATANGQVTFRGCAIGCLSTPHRKRELRSWIKAAFNCYDREHYAGNVDIMLERLRDEFGITEGLACQAERVFENLSFHGAAIEFIPAFAEALAQSEGRRITERNVDQFEARLVAKYGGLNGCVELEDRRVALLDWLRSRGK